MPSRSSPVRRSPDQGSSFSGIRRYSRRSVDLEVHIQDAEGWEVPLRAVDISPVGLFVESNFLFDVGDEHTLIFESPDEELMFRIRGRVTRVATGEGPDGESGDAVPGMAYEFVGTDAETWTRLCSLVAGG